MRLGAIEPKAHILSPGADMTRVLIVDDDPMVCAAIEVYLDRHGFEVTKSRWPDFVLWKIPAST